MYEQFFGFAENPFSITPDPSFFYLSPTHQEALAHLRYGIEEKKGFIVLTGEVGCGKTLLSRMLLNQLDPQRFETILIFNPQLDCQQLLKAILRDMGETPISDVHADLLHQMHTVFLNKVKQGKNIVLVVDEAQNLSRDVFEQIRLLSNLETDDQKLLQIILIGQPELKQRLNANDLRQLKQRVLVYYDVTPLNRKDVCHYVQHRLHLAAGETPPPQFSSWALSRIYRYSKGIPRVINNLCDKALLSAYAKANHEVCASDVSTAIKDVKRMNQ